jgi:hypothetical protein
MLRKGPAHAGPFLRGPRGGVAPPGESLLGAIRAAGESAAARRPFARLRMEPIPTDMAAPMELRLTLWHGGRESLLAQVHLHGAKVDWKA